MKREITLFDIFFLAIFTMLIFSGCRKDIIQGKIDFINNSNKYLIVYDAYSYPDTSLTSITWGGYNVEAQTKEALLSKNGWNEDIKEYNSKNTLILFVVFGDTLVKYGFDSVAASYNIAKRYDLTIDYLESTGWTVIFP